MAKYNPAGPPPIKFIFLIPDIQKQLGIAGMNRIVQDVQNGLLLALLRLTLNNPVHPGWLFLFCARA